MFDVAPQLQSALASARERLSSDAAATAQVGGSTGTRVDGSAMARLAQNAIFSEALLNAMHARLAELKSVTK